MQLGRPFRTCFIFSYLVSCLMSCFCLYICVCFSTWWILFLPFLSLWFTLSLFPPLFRVSVFPSPSTCLLPLHPLSLTRSLWPSGVQWRESWVWWTTCRAPSASTTRCPPRPPRPPRTPSPAGTAATRRSITTKVMTHSFSHVTGLIFQRNHGVKKWKLQNRKWCRHFWLSWLNPETLQKGFAS